MLARYMPQLRVCPSVCHKSKQLDGLSWFLVQSRPSAYPTPRYKEIRAASKRRVLPSRTLSQTLNLAIFWGLFGHSMSIAAIQPMTVVSSSHWVSTVHLCLQHEGREAKYCCKVRLWSPETGFIGRMTFLSPNQQCQSTKASVQQPLNSLLLLCLHITLTKSATAAISSNNNCIQQLFIHSLYLLSKLLNYNSPMQTISRKSTAPNGLWPHRGQQVDCL